jgi:signal transduction histidine kinase
LLGTEPLGPDGELARRLSASDGPVILAPDALRLGLLPEQAGGNGAPGAVLAVPLRAQDQVLGGLLLESAAPGRALAGAEQDLLRQLADRAALALVNARLYAASRSLTAELEQRVAARTRELAATNQALEAENAERKQAEAQIRALNSALAQRAAALEAANQELEAFSYSVSHDLRAPLRSIDGFSLALVEDYGAQLDVEAQGYLARVRASAQRMAALIDALLNLSRVARSALHCESVALSSLAEDIARELQQSEPQRAVAFVIQPRLAARGDARLLRVVLENLVGNAWKFTVRQPQPVIEFGARGEPDGPVFYVRDNGAGFDMAYAQRLFGAFQRLHGQHEYPGTGIGLATVQRIIHRHNGRVWAESQVGAGATFYFTLGHGA